MKQLKIAEWPESLNDQAAMLRLEPSDIQARSCLSFEDSEDALDSFIGAIAILSNGQIFGLIRYANNPVPGTIIVIEQGIHISEGGLGQFNNILAALGATADDIIWHRTD